MAKRYWLTVMGIVIGVPIIWYLVSPLFVNRRVDEAFPAPQATEAMEKVQAEGDQVMAEPMPGQAGLSVKILAQGTFYDIAHHGEGTATIYEFADGTRYLRFEDFEVLNGPDLYVYLAAAAPIPDTVGIALEGGVDLGVLKGNIGDQNYEIPGKLDLSGFQSVVIWCEPFRVPFSAATLEPKAVQD